jgi:hypothetical protein
LLPRCQGLTGSQQTTGKSVATMKDRWAALRALVPGQGAPQMVGQGGHELVADGLGGAPVRQADEHHVAGGPLHQGADRGGAVGADDQVACPVSGQAAGSLHMAGLLDRFRGHPHLPVIGVIDHPNVTALLR